MARLRPAAVLAAAIATAMLCSCGPSGGGSAASSQAAASSAPPAVSTTLASAAAASDEAASSAAVSALASIAAASASAAAPAPAPKKQPTAAELLRDDPAYAAKERRIEDLYGNARERDPTGQVEREQNNAVAQRRACADRACLDGWFRRREAALKQYVEN